MPVPPFETGLYTTTLTLQKLAVDDAGAITVVGSPLALYATIETVRVSCRNRVVNLSPMTLLQENNVVVEKGTTMTFTGLVLRSGVNTARSVAVGTSYADYNLVSWVEGAATWAFYGVIESYDQDSSKERTTYTLTLRHVSTVVSGTSVTNPVISGTA